MKKVVILSAALALVLTLAFGGYTASATPYVKGDAPQTEKEKQQTDLHSTAGTCTKDAKDGATCPAKSKADCASCPAKAKAYCASCKAKGKHDACCKAKSKADCPSCKAKSDTKGDVKSEAKEHKHTAEK